MIDQTEDWPSQHSSKINLAVKNLIICLKTVTSVGY